VRLNSLGNGLLLLELSSPTFDNSLRAADGNSILFIGKVVISQRKQQSSMQRLPFEPAVLFLALDRGGSVGPGGDLRLLTIVASAEKILEDGQHLTGKRCTQQQLGDLGCSRIEANWGYALVGKADNLKNRTEGKLE
jgi:hypothetical protein